ncbi:MAG: hypothetical protein ACK5LZ_06575, partial [Anaerorhabdus sp.]
ALAGEEAMGAYVDGKADTVANFTPGTDADYTLKITNNSDSAAGAFTAYVPIPKTGENFGTWFQDSAFKWDMAIASEVVAVAGFEVLYAVGTTEASYRNASEWMTYAELLAAGHSLSDVNMLKINATQTIDPGQEMEFLVPLKVDETFDSATNGEKIGTLNVYNPIYDVESATYTGTLPATKVGTELVIAEIGGLVFEDKDADGLYDAASDDTVVVGHTVELYVMDSAGSYVIATDAAGNPLTTITDASGTYLFNYEAGLGYDTYAVRFVEKDGGEYEYTINNTTLGKEGVNSDAIIANDLPNLGDTYRGWVLDIDATDAEAKTIGAGFLEYNPPIDLKVELPGPVEYIEETENTMTPVSIGPDFWSSIMSKTAAYTWELVNASDSQYVVLSNTNKESVKITALGVTPGGYEIELKLVIQDIYGNTAYDTTTVVVKASAPVISAVEGDHLVFEYGDVIDEETILGLLGNIEGENLDGAVFSINGIDALDLRLLDSDQEVELVATTASGEAKAIVTIVIKDTVAPEATFEDKVTYYAGDSIDEAQFLEDIGFAATDNYNSKEELTVVSTFGDVVFSSDGSTTEVVITITDSSGNTTEVKVVVEILRNPIYHIEAEGFTITMEEYLAMIEEDVVEEEVIERSNAASWVDHPVDGIVDLEVSLKNKVDFPTDLTYGDEFPLVFNNGASTVRRFATPYGLDILESTDASELQKTVMMEIMVPVYTVSFYDCNKEIIAQDWVDHGSDATAPTGMAYPTVSMKNITKNTDAYPVNCSGGFVIPNTGSR